MWEWHCIGINIWYHNKDIKVPENSDMYYGHCNNHTDVTLLSYHDDVIKWKHFPRYWPLVRGFHRAPVNTLHKGQWRGALMFSLICARINGSVNYREAGNSRCHRAHYDVTVMGNSIAVISGQINDTETAPVLDIDIPGHVIVEVLA